MSQKVVVVRFDEYGLFELGAELAQLMLVSGAGPLPVDVGANTSCYSKVNSACVKANTSCTGAIADSACVDINVTCGSAGSEVDAVCAGLNGSCVPSNSFNSPCVGRNVSC